MACCGDAFALNSTVKWSTTEFDDEFLRSFLPDEVVSAVTEAEERHDESAGRLASLSGTVVSIDAVYTRYELRPGERAMTPVAGSGAVKPLLDSNVVDDEELRRQGLRFVGYVVEINQAD
jgi:hypothetical protein